MLPLVPYEVQYKDRVKQKQIYAGSGANGLIMWPKPKGGALAQRSGGVREQDMVEKPRNSGQ